MKLYSEFRFDSCCLKLSTGDNAAFLDNEVANICNIVQAEEKVYIFYNKFRSKVSHFKYPCDSGRFDIYYVKKLSKTLYFAEVCNIKHKLVLLPHREGFVGLPLLHFA